MANTPPQDDRFYKGDTLLKWFAISSILMMVFTIWMVLDDFGRDWKGYQREFFALRTKKYKAWIEEAKGKVDRNKLDELKKQIAEADQSIAAKEKEIDARKAELVKLQTREKIATGRYQDAKAAWDVEKYQYENVYGHEAAEGHPDASPAEQKAYAKLDKDWDGVLALRDQMNQATQDRTDKEAQIAGFYAERDKTDKERKLARADLDRLESGEKSTALTLSKIFRSGPIIDMASPVFKIQQIVLPTIRDDIYFANVQKVDRCTTCHQAIDTPGYENEPNPFKTHPKLDLMLGSRSPHPLDKIGCTVCHEGRGQATEFVRAAHTPHSEEQMKDWQKKYGWHEQEHIIEKMIPLQYVEGKCRVCHKQTDYVPRAENLNAAVQLIRAAGCYGCHRIEGWDHVRKPAPSLKRIGGKVTRDWIVKWVSNPQSFNEFARMPSPFFQSNIKTEEHKQFQEAEVQAIADYVLSLSEPYKPDVHLALGDASRGKELVGSLGCLGCHQVDDFGRARGRWTMAPDLSTVGSKVSQDWLQSWISNPRHYWEGTTMPRLRLSASEISDISAYLLGKKNPQFEQAKVEPANLEVQKKVLKLYLMRDPKLAPTTDSKVDKVIAELKPHEITMQLGQNAVMRYGCFGCHEIKGFETTQGIGTDLSEEGSKPVNKLDYGLLHMERTNVAWFQKKFENTRAYDEGAVKEYLDLLRMPQFGFNEEERNMLTMTMLGYTAQKVMPPAAKELNAREHEIEEGLRVVHKYNCQGCHVVEAMWTDLPDGDPNKEAHDKTKYRLEGRILAHYADDETLGPPPLVTEGKRVKTNWVHSFVHDPSQVRLREKLKVRMPSFQMSNDELNALVTYWANWGEVTFPVIPEEPIHLSPQELTDAKTLFTKLQCLNCHTAGEKLTPAIMEGGSKGLAPDFLNAHWRLRKQWIVDLLKDPQKMVPGTRMPGFWPDMQSPVPDVLGGNSERQIDLLARYLLYLGQSKKSLVTLSE